MKFWRELLITIISGHQLDKLQQEEQQGYTMWMHLQHYQPK